MSANRSLAALLKPSATDIDIHAEVAPGGEAEIRMSLVNPLHSYEAIQSPATNLQRQLQMRLATEYDTIEVKKYPPALTIAGTVIFCSACWYGVFHLLF